jgi:hypothetical protein
MLTCLTSQKVHFGHFTKIAFRFLIPVVAIGIALAGCGGSSPSQSGSTTSPSSQPYRTYDPHWANAKYADCMRQHGVPVNGPDSYGDLGFAGGHIDRQTFLKAQQACQSLWPPSKGFSIDEILRAQDYRDRFNTCIQQHGQPAPGQPSGSGPPGPPAAQQECRAQLGPAPEVHGPHP